MKRVLSLSSMILAGCAAVTLSASHPVSAGDAEKPHVVELFTSQSCYSCPPAEAYLGELAARDDIVALEYHVDYWDDLVYGSAGKWKDVFSDPAFTQRQRGYAGSIKGGRSYTPQMVIDGRVAAVGSRRGEVRSALSRADAHRKDHATVTVTSNGGTGAAVEVSGGSGVEADIWIVRYDLKHETRVRAGENKGKTLVNHNIVRAVDWIGKWNGGTGRYTVENLGLGDNTGCAVIVQAGDYGPIVGAAKCPAAPGA